MSRQTDTSFLQLIAENTRDVISVFDPTFKRYFISKSVFELIAYTAEEVMRMDVNDPIHPDDLDEVGRIVNKTLIQKESCTVEHRLRHKKGFYVWVEVMVRPIYDDGGKLIWVLSSARDISDRRKKESELYAERRFREHLLDLSSITHELKTPLNAVANVAELILAQARKKEDRELLFKLRSSAEILLARVNNVLDFPKIHKRDFIPEEVNFNLHASCREVIKLYRYHAIQRKIKLTLDIGHDVPRFIISDPYRIWQILVNLVGNAVKFTHRGGVELVVKRKQTDGLLYICFIVKDSGIGIQSPLLNEIFLPFKQAGPDIARTYGGSGLGLSIVSRLVDHLHGTIDVRSIHGKGSVFSVTIPFSPMRSPQAKIKSILKGIKLLLVEDSLSNQLMIQNVLESAGGACVVTSSPKNIMTLIIQEKIDIVLLDVRLQNSTTYAVAKKIKNEKPDLPIIAYTADSSDATRQKLLKNGFDDFLEKPATPNRITTVLSKFVKKKSSSSLIDLSIYSNLSQDQSKYAEAIQLLEQDLRDFVKKAVTSVKKRDSRALNACMHQIWPVARQIKFDAMISLLNEIKSKQENWKNIENAVQKIQRLVLKVIKAKFV